MNKSIILIFCIFILLASSVFGAKTFSRTGYDSAPILSLELIEGGDLNENQTYFYRAKTGNTNRWFYVLAYSSAPSLIYNITTNSTHRSVNISITHSTGNSEYTYIWAVNETRPDYGEWNRYIDFPDIWLLGSVSTTSIECTGYPDKINYFVDNGTAQRVTYSKLGLSGNNYAYTYLYEHAQDMITISGGTTTEPITLDEIYLYALNNGWNLSSTIQRLDYGIWGTNNDMPINRSSGFGMERPTYLINAQRLTYTDATFKISDANVISKLSWLSASYTDGTEIIFGEHDTERDFSYEGVDFTILGHANQFGRLELVNGKIYDSKFRVRNLYGSTALSYGANFRLGHSPSGTFEIKDSDVVDGFSNGLEIVTTNPNPNSTISNVFSARARWETITASTMAFNITNWKLYVTSAGMWVRVYGTPQNTTLRDLVVKSYSLTYINLYLTIPSTFNYYTSLILINPQLANWDAIQMHKSGTINLSRINDSFIFRKHTLDLNVVNDAGEPINNSNISIYSSTSKELLVNTQTDDNGISGELLIPYTYLYHNESQTVTYKSISGNWVKYYPFDIVITHENYTSAIYRNIDINKKTEWIVTLSNKTESGITMPIQTIIFDKTSSTILNMG